MRLAVEQGQAWVTTGDPAVFEEGSAADSRAAIARQIERLEAACEMAGRDPRSLERILLTGFLPENPLTSVGQFEDFVGAHAELGITEIVVHAPIAGTQFEMNEAVYEALTGVR